MIYFLALFIEMYSFLPALNVTEFAVLAQGQADEAFQPPYAITEEEWFIKRSTILPAQDARSIQAAQMFFGNDDVSLEQAMKTYDVHGNRPTKSHNTASHDLISEVRPFSQSVLRRKTKKSPPKYDSNAQFIARHAETLIRQGHSQEEAITKAKERIDERNQKKVNSTATWRKIAATDPSLARKMNQKVPKKLAPAQYIPLRAHQLDHLGKANGMEQATAMAKAESQKEASRKAEYDQKRRAQRKQAKKQ